MTHQVLFLLICFLSGKDSASPFAEFKPIDNTILGTLSSLRKLRSTVDVSVVLFYTPECSSCISAKSAFTSTAKKLASLVPSVPMILLSCVGEAESFCFFKEKISHFPSLRIYTGIEFIEFRDETKPKKIEKFLVDRLLKSCNELTSIIETVKPLMEHREMSLVFFGGKEHPQFDQFRLLGVMYPYAHFYFTEKEELVVKSLELCLSGPKHAPEGSIILLQPDERKCFVLEGPINRHKALAFIEENDKAVLLEFGPEALSLQKFYKQPVVVLFTKELESPKSRKLFEDFKASAIKFKKRFIFTYIDGSKHLSPETIELMSHLGVDNSFFPCVRVARLILGAGQKKWKFEGLFARKAFDRFLSKISRSKARTYRKSQSSTQILEKNKILNEKIATNSQIQIRHVSASQLKKSIAKREKTSLILVTAGEEACPACSSFESLVQKSLSDQEKAKGKLIPFELLIFNSQLNELEGWTFDKVPELIVLSPLGAKKSISGEAKKDEIFAFFDQNLRQNKSTGDGDGDADEDL